MLPFDNKSEFQVIVDMPEGTPLEETARVARSWPTSREATRGRRTSRSTSGTASPYNFNGLVRHYFLRRGPNVADMQVNLAAEGRARRRRATTSPSACATRLAADRAALRRAHQGRRGAARAAGAADAGRRSLRPAMPRRLERSRGRCATSSSRPPASSTSTGTSRRRSRRRRSSSTREGARCSGMSARRRRRRAVRMATDGATGGLLHDARASEDVPIVAAPAARREPRALAGAARRARGWARTASPLGELARDERDAEADEHLSQEPDAGDLRDRRCRRRDREPGLRDPAA